MANSLLPVILIIQLSLLLYMSSRVSGNEEKMLIGTLMASYNTPLGRPVQNVSSTLPVALAMSLFRVVEANPEQMKLVIFAALRHQWKDSLLQWDPSGFGGITNVNLDIKDIWSPNFDHIDALDPPLYMLNRMAHPVVDNTGTVSWETVYKFTTACRTFKQGLLTCSLSIGSWTTPTDKVDLELKEELISTDAYDNNEDWEMHSTKVSLQKFKYQGREQEYASARFEVQLRERDWFKKQQEQKDSKATATTHSTVLLALLCISLTLHNLHL